MDSVSTPAAHVPVREVHTYDDFTTNCAILEASLSEDLNDPRPHINTLMTWVNWVKGGNGTTEHRLYLWGESLPKIVKSMLTRKYISDPAQTDAVFEFLKEVASVITDEFLNDIENLQLLVCELLDPNKQFYTKHGFAKAAPPVSTAGTQTAASAAWRDSVEVSSCLDAQNDLGMWEVVFVERISPTQTEVEITWSNGKLEWFPLDNPRIAEFGTKTGLANPQPESEPTTAPAMASTEPNTPADSDVVVIPTDEAWRQGLGVGSTLDCKDTTGTWYQSVALEVREVEKEVKVTVPAEASEASEGDDVQPAMDIQEERITMVEKQLRVALIGWPEKYDEWIDAVSDRLAPLDSRSFGKRGELAIRKEIKFVVPQDKPADVGLFAAPTHPQFYSKYYVGLVQMFGELGGFDMISRRLQVEVLPLPLITRLKLFEALGMPYELYTPFFFQTCFGWFKQLAARTLLSIPEPELRNVNRDMLQGALKSLENLTIANSGRQSQDLRAFETAHVGVAQHCLHSPYLNRRLDGLKLLNDFVTRVQNAEQYPSGLKVTQHKNSQGVETGVSYEVVPLAVCMSAEQLATLVTTNGLIPPLFRGDKAHTSLMERSVKLLKFLATHNQLPADLIQTIWEVGDSGEKEALKALQDTIEAMSLQLLQVLFETVQKKGTLTVEVVDIFVQIGRKTRTLVLQTEGEAAADWDIANQVHQGVLSVLCSGSDEKTVLPEVVASKTANALEELSGFPPGESALEASKWVGQWVRTVPLLEWCVSCLEEGRNVLTSLRILQMLISAWPKGSQRRADGELVAELSLGDDRVPFQEGTRSVVSSYFEQKYNIVARVSSEILRVKSNFSNSTAEVVAEAVKALNLDDAATVPHSNLALLLPSELQKVLNEQAVGNSRHGYLEEMQKRLDFLLFFVRSSELLEIPQAMVAEIWNAMVFHVVTKKEQEMMFNWLGRIAVKLNKAPGTDVDEDVTRVIVCSDTTVDWIFAQLLCDEQFIASSFFCDSALACVDRFFRHINARNGRLLEAAKTFKIVDTELEGLDIFWRILMDTADDAVALKAAKLITSLPSKLDGALRVQLPAFRLAILDQCMERLHNSTSSKHTARLVSLLNALLDESAADARGKIRTHGGNSRGAALKLRVNCSGKMHKPEDPFLTMYAQDTGEDLLGAVAAAVKLRPSEIKIYCSGKELSADDRKRSLSELRIKNSDAIMVVAKVAATGSGNKQADSKAEEQPATTPDIEVPIESLPAVVLSTSAKHFGALFQLLEVSSGEACDMVWNVLMRLPTNPELYNGWLALENEPADLLQITHDDEAGLKSSALTSNSNAVSLPKLLYTLQILEGLIQPAETAAELEELTAATASDVDDEAQSQRAQQLMQDWPTRFIAKGGVTLLCDIFIGQPLFTHAISDTLDQEVPGVTRKLLLQTLRSLLKIVNACIRQGTSVLDETMQPSITMLAEELQRRSVARLPILLQPPQQTAPPVEFAPGAHPPMLASPTTPPQPPPLPGDAEAQEPSTEGASPAQTEVAAQAWGWRLELVPADITNLFSTLPLDRLLERILEVIALFVDVAATLPKWRASTSSSPSVKLQEVNLSIMDPLDCLLGMAGVLLMFNPALVEQFGHFNQQDGLSDWLSYVLLSPTRTGTTTTATVTNVATTPSSTADVVPGEVIGQWLKNSLLFLVQFAEALPNKEDTPTPAVLRHRLLTGLLQSRCSFAAVTAEQLPHAAALYLYFKCTRELIGDGTVLLAEQRIELATTLLEEIGQFNDHVKAGRFSAGQEEVVAGNLLLLATLIEVDTAVFDLVLRWNLHFLLLSKFLGLYFEEATTADNFYNCMEQPIYCLTDASQRAVLRVLLVMAQHSAELARSIFGWLKLAYSVTPLADGWSYKPDNDSRSAVGFVGLRNLGCTCYMNALIQQLFMISSFRHGVLSAPQLTYTDEEQKDDIVRHLQHMFANLHLSERKAYRPSGWAYAFKDETGTAPINPALQQDAQEFFAVLCDRLEFGLRNTAQASITKDTMEGRITNQILKADQADSDVRESEEPFYCLSLRVEGISDVERSLQDFVQGETIPDYAWDDAGQERVTILKRQCLSVLPQTLILHLKRFELNFDTFMREKINSEFKFPMHLNMFPYTKQGLAARDRGQTDLQLSDDQYNYNLVGIVVHSGSADMGHYYSIIRDRRTAGAWIEFNDSETRTFNESRLADECFGGKRTVYDLNATTRQFTASESVSYKSAYMLIYERADAVAPDAAAFSPSSVAEDFMQEIRNDNRMHRLSSRVYTKAHMLFFTKLLQAMKLEDLLKETQTVESVGMLNDVCAFVLGPQSRAANHDPYKTACVELGKIYAQHPEISALLLKRLSSDFMRVKELILAPEVKVREGTCSLLWELLQATAAVDRTKIFQDHSVIVADTMTAIKAQNDSEADAQQQKRQKQGSGEHATDAQEVQMQVESGVAESKLQDQPSERQQQAQEQQQEQEQNNCNTSWVAVFMSALTSDRMFATIAEQWRRSYQFTVLLLKWAKADWFHRHFLIRREVILQICDLVVGDSSPACNALYVKGTRKRAPASYVTVSVAMLGKPPASEWLPRPLVNTGSSATTLQSTPDWTCLMELLSWLVRSCKSQSMTDMKGIPDTLLNSDESAPDLDEWSSKCLKNKTLYSTALKQARYTSSIIDVVRHMSHEYIAFSNDAADVLADALSATNTEATAHIFEAIDSFLSISDSLRRHRAMRLFTGTNSILASLRAQSEVTDKFACVCLRSIVTLVRRHTALADVLRGGELFIWAPWTLKFSYTFREKSTRQDETAAAAATVYSSVTGDAVGQNECQKGPKVIVFGEAEDERELRWGVRAALLFDSLRALVSDLGGDPDDLIPADAFIEAAPAQEEAPMSQDQLDDEEFARQLQQMEDSSVLDVVGLD